MPSYSYRARNGNHLTSGTVEAENTTEASSRLREQGFTILSLSQSPTAGHFHLSLKRHHVPFKEKIIFTRQLSVMIRAGLPIVKALEALERQSESQYFKEIIRDLATQIKGGKTLSKVMARYPQVFPEVYIAVVKAGEETGQLADVLLTLADQQEKDADLIGKIKSAMIYPAVILCALIGVAFLVIFFVLPNLQSIFADSGQKLPILTRILLGTSTLMRHYFLVFVVMVVAAVIGVRYWISRPSGRSIYDRLKISLPIFGPLTKKVYMARFSRTLSMLIKASLPILSSIKIVRKTINNSHYDDSFDRVERAVESGKSLSAALDKEKLFPAMVSQLTNLGEESGSLDKVLLEVADFYDKEVDAVSRNLSALLEPLLLIIMGIGVGFVVAAVLGPIYGLVQNFSG